MSHLPFEAAVRRMGEAVIIDLEGEIDSFADAGLLNIYQQAIETNPQHIILNFSKVHYINSTGIALVVRMLSQARKAGRRLSTYGLSDHYMEIFEITRLSEYLQNYPDEESALAGQVGSVSQAMK